MVYTRSVASHALAVATGASASNESERALWPSVGMSAKALSLKTPEVVLDRNTKGEVVLACARVHMHVRVRA